MLDIGSSPLGRRTPRVRRRPLPRSPVSTRAVRRTIGDPSLQHRNGPDREETCRGSDSQRRSTVDGDPDAWLSITPGSRHRSEACVGRTAEGLECPSTLAKNHASGQDRPTLIHRSPTGRTGAAASEVSHIAALPQRLAGREGSARRGRHPPGRRGGTRRRRPPSDPRPWSRSKRRWRCRWRKPMWSPRM